MRFSVKQARFMMAAALLIFTATMTLAAEEKDTIRGKLYCAKLEGTELKLEPGVCPPGSKGTFHVVRTQEGPQKIILLQDSPIMREELAKLKIDRTDDVTITGKRTGPTVFTPETLRVR